MGLHVPRLYYFPVAVLLLASPIVANKVFHSEGKTPFAPAPVRSAVEYSTSIEKLLEMPEDEIDIGKAALIFSQEIYPGVDLGSYSKKIDVLADQVRRLAKGDHDPDRRIRCLNTVLLLNQKFQGTRDLSSARQSEKYFLNRVLDTKQGNCVSMPLLYIAVAQRLGWPVYLVDVPDHSFVRYVDPTLREQNIETTSNGGYVSDERYAKDFFVSEEGRKSGAYLRTLTHREALGDLAAINGVAFGQQGRHAKSAAYLELATKLNSRNAAAWSNLRIAYTILAKHSTGPESKMYSAMANKCSKKLDELGFVNPKDVPQFSSTGRPQ